MILLYIQNQFIELTEANQALLKDAIWIDLHTPSEVEINLVEETLNIAVPSKKEMKEIEPSNRLYTDDDNLFMTATMVAKSNSPYLTTDAVTFILTEHKLITVRYIEPHVFKVFIARLSRSKKKNYNAEKIFIGLLEATTGRLADILENVTHELDDISHAIFRANNHIDAKKINYQTFLKKIGSNGDLATRVRESLISFIRIISFYETSFSSEITSDISSRLSILEKDISALSDYAGFISTKINFLVDATMGMVNIEQNNIIKALSVAAVIFLPPTLIASIYGMNFELIPELHSPFGYPIAIVLMILSGLLPYLYFKKRKWL